MLRAFARKPLRIPPIDMQSFDQKLEKHRKMPKQQSTKEASEQDAKERDSKFKMPDHPESMNAMRMRLIQMGESKLREKLAAGKSINDALVEIFGPHLMKGFDYATERKKRPEHRFKAELDEIEGPFEGEIDNYIPKTKGKKMKSSYKLLLRISASASLPNGTRPE
mmetsp:Transcript_33857/g.58978  ORF Transcript_33857/g.58978 Transcript_33857/m.58978 type:complete len:166 (+) Transcript_33857:3839-4336(+)